MKLITSFLVVVTVVEAVASNIFQDWNANDIIQYLKDQGDDAKNHVNNDLEELKKYANERWLEKAEPKPWWKVWPDSKNEDWWDMTGSGSQSASISDWLFETWSSKDLRKLLRHSGVKFDPDISHEKLKNLAKSNFDKISKKLQTSGYYLTDNYLKLWDEYDLKAWLDKHGVSYSNIGVHKDDLKNLVRKNMYKASKVYEDEKYQVLDSLDLSQRKLFDTGNKLKADLFNLWSSDDIIEWLNYHRVKVADATKQNRDQLIGVAVENLDLLQDDINWFIEEARKRSSSILSKDVEAAKSVWGSVKENFDQIYSADNIINDTFLIGVKSWPKKRLQDFLNARGVKYHLLSTRDELLELVYQNRNKPLKSWEKTFNSVKKWWNEQPVVNNLKSSSADMLEKMSTMESNMLEQLQSSFEKWSDKDLTAYLKSFTGKPTELKDLSREDLINKAKQNTMWFFGIPQKPWYSRIPDHARTLVQNAYAYFRY